MVIRSFRWHYDSRSVLNSLSSDIVVRYTRSSQSTSYSSHTFTWECNVRVPTSTWKHGVDLAFAFVWLLIIVPWLSDYGKKTIWGDNETCQIWLEENNYNLANLHQFDVWWDDWLDHGYGTHVTHISDICCDAPSNPQTSSYSIPGNPWAAPRVTLGADKTFKQSALGVERPDQRWWYDQVQGMISQHHPNSGIRTVGRGTTTNICREWGERSTMRILQHSFIYHLPSRATR